MKRSVHYSEAKRALSRIQTSQSFWLCTNENLRSLSEIVSALSQANDEVFRYHVSRDKNDFETWIRDVIKDKELAREISRVKTKETLIRKISERIEFLLRIEKRHQMAETRKKTVRAKKRKSAAKKATGKTKGKGKKKASVARIARSAKKKRQSKRTQKKK